MGRNEIRKREKERKREREREREIERERENSVVAWARGGRFENTTFLTTTARSRHDDWRNRRQRATRQPPTAGSDACVLTTLCPTLFSQRRPPSRVRSQLLAFFLPSRFELPFCLTSPRWQILDVSVSQW